MTNTREEVIERAKREFELLERLVAGLSDETGTCRWAAPKAKTPGR
jgi:hypothetical protein